MLSCRAPAHASMATLAISLVFVLIYPLEMRVEIAFSSLLTAACGYVHISASYLRLNCGNHSREEGSIIINDDSS